MFGRKVLEQTATIKNISNDERTKLELDIDDNSYNIIREQIFNSIAPSVATQLGKDELSQHILEFIILSKFLKKLLFIFNFGGFFILFSIYIY